MKSKKLLVISMLTILLVAMLTTVMTNVVYAAPGDFSAITFSDQKANDIVGKIMGFTQWIGSAVAVVILIVIGIKYMVGSAEEKAEYKKTFVPYIVGAILIFSAVNIASFVYNAVK